MKLTRKQISTRWRIVTVGVLFAWLTTRGLCVAAPLFSGGCCENEGHAHSAIASAHEDHKHDSHNHQDDHADHDSAAGHHSQEDTGKPADSGESWNCCDVDAVTAKLAFLSGHNPAFVSLSSFALLSSWSLIEAPSTAPDEPPPVSLRALSLLLLGPGHQPHGPPLL